MTFGERYFDKLYAENPDPWKFIGSAYEDDKYDATVAALAGRHYGRALEVGCSIGILSGRLAPHVDRLVATDLAESPLASARTRNAGAANITFLKAAFPEGTPPGPYDLIVFSEVLYYLDWADLHAACQAALDHLAPGGDIVLVHWLGDAGHPLRGDEASEGFIRMAGPALIRIRRTRTADYRLDVFRKRPATSRAAIRRARFGRVALSSRLLRRSAKPSED